MFFEIGALKNIAMFTTKYLCWSYFLMKMQTRRPAIILKIDSNIGAFLWNLRRLLEHLFYRRFTVAASRHIFWTVSLLHMRMINGVIAWYVLALHRLFRFIACVSFFSISFSLFIFCGCYYLLRYWGKFVNTSSKALELCQNFSVEFRGVNCFRCI